jgi:DNA-directed RNA polymerase specialized sigma24 family protein
LDAVSGSISRDEAPPSLENRLLRARARGEISTDAAFEKLFLEYGRLVASWLAVRADPSVVEDLAQDVWLIFYGRFRRWEFGVEMESSEARPVLSFLFRTCQFVARGHRRLAENRKKDPLDDDDPRTSYSGQAVLRDVEASRALSIARRVCPEEELDVLLAKLAGLSAREIGKTLSMTEAVVDHRYRDAVARLRREMSVDSDKARASRKSESASPERARSSRKKGR